LRTEDRRDSCESRRDELAQKSYGAARLTGAAPQPCGSRLDVASGGVWKMLGYLAQSSCGAARLTGAAPPPCGSWLDGVGRRLEDVGLSRAEELRRLAPDWGAPRPAGSWLDVAWDGVWKMLCCVADADPKLNGPPGDRVLNVLVSAISDTVALQRVRALGAWLRSSLCSAPSAGGCGKRGDLAAIGGGVDSKLRGRLANSEVPSCAIRRARSCAGR
jgi:hypothetical protein